MRSVYKGCVEVCTEATIRETLCVLTAGKGGLVSLITLFWKAATWIYEWAFCFSTLNKSATVHEVYWSYKLSSNEKIADGNISPHRNLSSVVPVEIGDSFIIMYVFLPGFLSSENIHSHCILSLVIELPRIQNWECQYGYLIYAR